MTAGQSYHSTSPYMSAGKRGRKRSVIFLFHFSRGGGEKGEVGTHSLLEFQYEVWPLPWGREKKREKGKGPHVYLLFRAVAGEEKRGNTRWMRTDLSPFLSLDGEIGGRREGGGEVGFYSLYSNTKKGERVKGNEKKDAFGSHTSSTWDEKRRGLELERGFFSHIPS